MDDLEEMLNSIIAGDQQNTIPVSRLRNYINQLFVEDVKKRRQESPREGFHGSDLLPDFKGKYRFCYRQHTLGRFYRPAEEKDSDQFSFFDIKMVRIQKLGWYVHLMFQRIWREFGHAIAIERTHYHEKYGVYFTPDIEAMFPKLDPKLRKYIIEIKSMNTKKYEEAVLCESAEQGHPQAFKQTQIYMMLLEYEKGIVLIFDKNNSNFHFWEVDHDPNFTLPYKERLDNLIQLYPIYENGDGSDNSLAKPVCDSPDAPRAKVCPMRDVCWLKNKAERVQFLKGEMKNKEQQNVSLIHETQGLLDDAV